MRCYMINLFERFDGKSQKLKQSLQLAGYNHTTIVMDDDGFLPDDVLSPYRFFADYQRLDNDKPAFFNDVQVPPFWEIKGSNDYAEVIDNGIVRGRIFYRKHFKTRIVSFVEWFDPNNHLRSVDYYTKDGFKFATTVYDLEKKPIVKTYINREGKEVLYENFVTKDIVLDWKGQSHFFASKHDFIIFFLKQLKLDLSKIIINSLATPFFVTYRSNIVGKTVLFWQEQSGGNVPGNMKQMLDNKSQQNTVIIPDKNEYQSIIENIEPQYHSSIAQSGYLYDYQKTNKYSKRILNLTNSDDIPNIEILIQTLPEFEFHIGAITEMSEKLMHLDQYPNVTLYPTITKAMTNELFNSCDIYLDINRGGEISNAIERAMLSNQLILAYDETAHRREFIARNNIVPQTNYAQLTNILTDIGTDKNHFKERLEHQKQQNNKIDKRAFKKILNKAMK